MSEEREGRLVSTDEDGWKCRLERRHSAYEGEWFAGVTVFDAEGNEVLHSGMTKMEMTEEAAMKWIQVGKQLMAALGLPRRKETESCERG